MAIRSLPARVAIYSSLAGGLCVLTTALVFGALQKKQIEAQVVREGRHYAERFTTWTLGYFYQQDNLLHLETQQRFLGESPNILYSYIVKGTGEIDVGIEGINSPEIGSRQLEWEKPLPLRFDSSVSESFRATQALVSKLGDKVRLGEEVLLVGFPISCPERGTPCAQLRVALVARTAQGMAKRLTFTLVGFGLLAAILTGAAVFETTRRQVRPLRRITQLMEKAHQGGDAAISTVRASLEESHKSDSAELASLRRSLIAYLDTLEIAASHEAVARTTQALAHDVRRPFSMFKSIIQIVEATEDPGAVREVLKLTLPEVNQAMASVEGMIQDVMQIGTDSKVHLEDVAPDALIEAALGELFRVYPEADVSISYDLSHKHMVRADSLRVGRVFANILGNAVQAMREKGNLWIRTRERDGTVEFSLGNAGSSIPPEILPKLFDAFFTSGKKGGTGLGLAIAKKIVDAHGGTIRCVSERNDAHPSGMVEFIFSLPVSEALCLPRSEPLPRTSREFHAALEAVRIAATRLGSAGSDPREAEIERAILARLDAPNRPDTGPVTVLVVEDEAVYRNGLLALLDRSEDVSALIRMVFARNDKEALAAVRDHAPVLLIEDVDLGPTSKDGLQIVKTLRESGFTGHICVHSNRFLAGDNKAALAAGADTVLPKPMGHVHFLKLVLAALPEQEAIAPPAPPASRTLTVALLDDSISMRLSWKMELEDETHFRAFASTMAFFEACEKEPSYLSSLDAVITDYNFAPGDPHTGGTLARALRERGYEGVILRASGESDLGPEIEALFDGDVGKAALEWPEFLAAVEAAKARRQRA